MSVKLITYDLNSQGQKHAEVLAKIKEFGTWARLSESSYAVKSSLTTEQICNKFTNLIDDNDSFLVIPMTQFHCGWTTEDVHDWLDNNLT